MQVVTVVSLLNMVVRFISWQALLAFSRLILSMGIPNCEFDLIAPVLVSVVTVSQEHTWLRQHELNNTEATAQQRSTFNSRIFTTISDKVKHKFKF